MRPGERETGLGVIERRRVPRSGRMARVAGRGETGSHVVRISGLVEIRHVAAGTHGGQAGVVVVHMAGRALDADVGPG